MELVNEIYSCAKHGSWSKLKILLSSSNPEDRSKLIEHKTKDGDQITTPLIIASLNGHIKCVEILLSYDADTEARGTIKVDGQIIEEASALWAAAVKKDKDIVKLLIEKGTNVNAGTKTNSTPLRVAAYDGRLDIVSYLVDHGADVNVKNNFENTPLMVACYRGHRSVVNYLIEKGANIDAQEKQGNTALNFAVEGGHVDIVKDLVTKGASTQLANTNNFENTPMMVACYRGHRSVVNYLIDKGAKIDAQNKQGNTALHSAAEGGHLDIVKDLVTIKGASTQLANNLGLTPLLLASNNCKIEMVEYFIARPECSKLEEIHGLELLGATIANNKNAYDIDKSYDFMMRGMKKRYEGDKCVIRKAILPPIQAYQNRVECQTEDELKDIQKDSHAIHMEGLIVRERILGPNNSELRFPICYRGAHFADSDNFEPCIALWKHALDIGLQNDMAKFVIDLESLRDVFCLMIQTKVFPNFPDVYDVLKYAVLEYEKVSQKIQKAEDKTIESLKDDLESVVHSSLYLLTIFKHLNLTESNEQLLHQLLYRYLCMNPRTKEGKTLIHLAVSGATPINESYGIGVCSYPCYETTKLLLQTGGLVNTVDNRSGNVAKIDAQDKQGNTALHEAAEGGQLDIVKDLVTKGASTQLANNLGLTPLLVASNKCEIEVVEYLIARPDCSKLEEIHSLELLGATIANDQDAYDIDKSYEFMMRGMEKRYEGNKCVIRKAILPPIQAYQNRVECQTEDELKDIQKDSHAIHMEGLVVRERILGPNNTELCYPILYRGAIFADSANFEPCLALWKHAMDIGQQNDLAEVVGDLESLRDVLCDMLQRKVFPSFPDVYDVLEHAVLEYEKISQKIEKAKEDKSIESLQDDLESVVYSSLYLVTIFIKHLNLTDSDEKFLHLLLHRYLCMNPRTKEGKTLINLAVSGAAPIDERCGKGVCSYPCYETTELLLQTGAQVNSVDIDGNTPLHAVVMTKPKQGQEETVEKIITSLYDYGVHEDVINTAGKTALEVVATKELKDFLILKRRIVLKCLAARAIKHYQLEFTGLVPKMMELFISAH